MNTAGERASSGLRAEILSGALRPGEQLVQEDIADRYGISRIPVREALQSLASEGLATYIPNRGYFVTELSVEDLVEVYRLRKLLETEAIREALPVLSDEDVATLRQYAQEVVDADAAGDVAGVTDANRAFHFALYSMAAMPRLCRLLHQLWDTSEVYRAYYFREDGNRQRILSEHTEMIEAIADRDVKRTIRLQDEHREHSVAWLRNQLRRQQP